MDLPDILRFRSESKEDFPHIEGYFVQCSESPGGSRMYRYEKRERSPSPQRRPKKEIPDRGEVPGESPPQGGRAVCFNNTMMILTYKGHIPKSEYKSWFENQVVPKYSYAKEGSPPQEVNFFGMAHETGDKAHPYLHTHVVFSLRHPLKTRDARVLDYEGIHPNWNYIQSKKHLKNATSYLAKEDPDNEHLKEAKTESYDFVTAVSECNSPQDIVSKVKMSRPSDIFGLERILKIMPPPKEKPRVTVDHFFRWQKEALEIMNRNSLPLPPLPILRDPASREKRERIPIPGLAEHYTSVGRAVYLVRDKKGGSGKTVFIKALQASDPKRFLVIAGIPFARDFATIIGGAMELGWTGDAILFNITRTQIDYESFSATIEQAIDGFVTKVKYAGGTELWEPKNVWIFCNNIPKLTGVSTDRWRIYSVDADFKSGDISWLEPLSFGEAKLEYDAMHEDIEDDIPRRGGRRPPCRPKF